MREVGVEEMQGEGNVEDGVVEVDESKMCGDTFAECQFMSEDDTSRGGRS